MNLPVAAGISVTADLLVDVFLGNKWTDAAPLIKILAWFGALMAIQTNISAVYMALGKPQISTYLNILNVSLLIPMIVVFTLRHPLIFLYKQSDKTEYF